MDKRAEELKAERLAAALRANLARRKARTRGEPEDGVRRPPPE